MISQPALFPGMAQPHRGAPGNFSRCKAKGQTGDSGCSQGQPGPHDAELTLALDPGPAFRPGKRILSPLLLPKYLDKMG